MFVQIIEGRVRDAEELAAMGEEWDREVRPGAVGFLGVTAGTAADGRSITVVRFEDEASAQANSARAEQHAFWEKMSKLYDGEVSFTESTDVTELLGGGSNDAGFVQVMKSTGVDRGKTERADDAMLPFVGQRGDVLGGIRIWTGSDSCTEVIYFTSEAEARRGEQLEMPPELQAAMADAMDGVQIEYLDLPEPHIR
jgi:hypothetical protein